MINVGVGRSMTGEPMTCLIAMTWEVMVYFAALYNIRYVGKAVFGGFHNLKV